MGTENIRYRVYSLNENGVFIQGAADPLPESLADEVERLFRRRTSPELELLKSATQ